MKKLFVSVPMNGREAADIKKSIAKMKTIAEVILGEELELIDSYVEDQVPKNTNQRIWYLSKSIEKLAGADVFIGITCAYDWAGCEIEERVARNYGIQKIDVPAEYVIDDYRELMNARFSRETCMPVCDR